MRNYQFTFYVKGIYGHLSRTVEAENFGYALQGFIDYLNEMQYIDVYSMQLFCDYGK